MFKNAKGRVRHGTLGKLFAPLTNLDFGLHSAPARLQRRMALSKLRGDEQRIVFSYLCNVLDPGIGPSPWP